MQPVSESSHMLHHEAYVDLGRAVNCLTHGRANIKLCVPRKRICKAGGAAGVLKGAFMVQHGACVDYFVLGSDEQKRMEHACTS
jgi:hypothetical protein